MKRVLLVCDVTSWMRGGVITELIHLVEGLRSRSIDVALLADHVPEGCSPLRHYPLTLPARRSIAGVLLDALTKFRPDVVHAVALGAAASAKVSSVMEGRSWVATVHSVPPWERIFRGLHRFERGHYFARGARFFPNALAWRWMLTRGVFPHIVVHSDFVGRVVTRYGLPVGRLSVIPIGLDLSSIVRPLPSSDPSADRPLKIVSVGGFAHTKGQHDLIKAVSLLKDQWPDIKLDLIGEVRDPTYMRFLEQLIARYGLIGQACFHVRASNASKAELLAQADVYVQPSHEEGFCLAFAEACVVCPRVVGTQTGAIAQIAGSDVGVHVVPIRSPEQLADAIRNVTILPVLESHLAVRHARLSALLSWETYTSQHIAMYEQMVGNPDRLQRAA